MRKLFTLDRHDYEPDGTVFYRPSVRAIVIREGKVLMVHSLKYDYYKFPGGGMEPGENRLEALCRETAEESGYRVLPETVREYGSVLRRERHEVVDIFHQENYYYLCQVAEFPEHQDLDDYEAEERFTPEWVEPKVAVDINRNREHGDAGTMMRLREARVLEMLLDEGYFG